MFTGRWAYNVVGEGGGGYKFGGLSVISYRGVISQVEKVVITRGKFPLF